MNFTRTDEEARYRLSLKKQLKTTGIPYKVDSTTEVLEKQVEEK
jgi:hypothetical protein